MTRQRILACNTVVPKTLLDVACEQSKLYRPYPDTSKRNYISLTHSLIETSYELTTALSWNATFKVKNKLYRQSPTQAQSPEAPTHQHPSFRNPKQQKQRIPSPKTQPSTRLNVIKRSKMKVQESIGRPRTVSQDKPS